MDGFAPDQRYSELDLSLGGLIGNQRPKPDFQQAMQPPMPYNLLAFYDSDAPWHPHGLAPPSDSQSNHSRPANHYNNLNPSFQHYRSKKQASECSTLAEDSGYHGSLPTVDTASVYEEDRSNGNPEALRTVQQLSALSFSPDSGWPQNPSPPPSNTNHTFNGTVRRYWCRVCGKWLKTKSELNKHDARHQKPFHCDVPNCARSIEGFSTKNDLERHQNSVHPEVFRSGTRYVCHEGACATKPQKLWPRADNFRSHLKRVHKKSILADDDINEYVYGRRPSHGQDLKGIGASISSIDHYRSQEIHLTPSFSSRPQFSSTPMLDGSFSIDQTLHSLQNEGRYVTPGELIEPPNESISPVTLGQQSGGYPGGTHQHGHNGSNNRYAETDGQQLRGRPLASSEAGQQDQEHSESDAPEDGSQSDSQSHHGESDAPTDVTKSLGGSASLDFSRGFFNGAVDYPQEFFDMLKSIPREFLEKALKTDSSEPTGNMTHANNMTREAKIVCPFPDCDKIFGRQCELKKHSKRHEKPYGCTFRGCGKLFGSKNDWKRHESSQHFQLEEWRCGELKPNGQELCNKVCHRRENFKAHLQKDHSIEDLNQVEEKLDSCRIGRHCETRFWCGFCRTLVEVTEGINAWTLRCDHIDDHFFGRGGKESVTIARWEHLEDQDEPQNGNSLKQDPNASNIVKRKRAGEADLPPLKRTRERHGYMWICCVCRNLGNLKTSAACLDCAHEKCMSGCDIEKVHVDD